MILTKETVHSFLKCNIKCEVIPTFVAFAQTFVEGIKADVMQIKQSLKRSLEVHHRKKNDAKISITTKLNHIPLKS